MSNVTLSIGGRSFTVACAAGEEAHVLGLGNMIDAKLSAMGDMAGQSEARTLLFAALLLADELHEVKSGKGRDDGQASQAVVQMVEKLEAIASHLENLADKLES